MFDVVGFVRSLTGPTQVHGFLGSAIDRVWFLLFCASLPLIWKVNKEWFSYSLLMGLIPAMTLSFTSFTRYVLVIFPVFVVFSNLLFTGGREKWSYLLMAALFGVQVIFIVLHINDYWAQSLWSVFWRWELSWRSSRARCRAIGEAPCC
jgi:hypothetical protein